MIGQMKMLEDILTDINKKEKLALSKICKQNKFSKPLIKLYVYTDES